MTGEGPDPGRRSVLVTRPEPGLGETMRAVRELGFTPVACPTLSLRAPSRAVALPVAPDVAAILLTSRQAVAPLSAAAARIPALFRLPLLAVGDATAARARAAGFAASRSAGGDARDLARLVRATLPPGSMLLLPTGRGQGRALADALRAAGYRVARRSVYVAEAPDRLPEDGASVLRSDRALACLFFSGQTARNFVRLCPVPLHGRLDRVRALAISTAASRPLGSLPWRAVEIAPHPDAASLLALLRSQP